MTEVKLLLGSNCKHIDRKPRVKGMCKSCYNWSLLNSTPEKREKYLLYQKKRYKPIHKDKQKNSHLKHRYGITLEDFRALEKAQNNYCYICKKEFIHTPYTDHCHETGKVRKLLCSSCNIAVGSLESNPERLEALINYLKEFNSVAYKPLVTLFNGK